MYTHSASGVPSSWPLFSEAVECTAHKSALNCTNFQNFNKVCVLRQKRDKMLSRLIVITFTQRELYRKFQMKFRWMVLKCGLGWGGRNIFHHTIYRVNKYCVNQYIIPTVIYLYCSLWFKQTKIRQGHSFRRRLCPQFFYGPTFPYFRNLPLDHICISNTRSIILMVTKY